MGFSFYIRYKSSPTARAVGVGAMLQEKPSEARYGRFIVKMWSYTPEATKCKQRPRTGLRRYFSASGVMWTTAQVLLKWPSRPLWGCLHVWAVGVVME